MRIFNTYGPRMHPNDGRVVSNFIVQALRGEDITIYGDGTKSRDFTYIQDIVQANVKAMDKGTGEFNIGGGYNITVLQLAEKIIAATRSTSKITYENAVKGDAEHTSANITKAAKELGWIPKTPLDEGLEIYKKWIQQYQL